MTSEDTKTLEFNQNQKSDKTPLLMDVKTILKIHSQQK